ncbi:MAG: ABC transporter permease [Longimicrobiales bacterium]
MERVVQDVRFALRQLRRRPVFALVAALSLAVGIGANTAIFSAVHALLLRPVPGVVAPERVVEVGRSRPDGSGFDTFAYPDFLDLREQVAALESLSAYRFTVFSYTQGGEGQRVNGLHADPAYAGVMGVRPALGRWFGPGEDAAGARPRVAVISHAFWTRAFGADPAAVGAAMQVNRIAVEIVGVMPEDFRGHTVAFEPDVYLPLRARATLDEGAAGLFDQRGSSWHNAVGRLAPSATVAQADEQVRGVYARLAEAYPDTNAGRSGRVVPLGLVPGGGRGPVAAFLSVLMGMVALILVVTCANVAGMFVARASAREREIAVRLSLGAGRSRLVQQLLTESLLVFVVGGGVGTMLGAWAMGLLPIDRLPVPVSLRFDLSPDPAVLGFAVAVTLLTGLVFGLLPALQATRVDLAASLKDDGTSRRGAGFLRRAFVATQVGVSVVLLVSAGLLLRTLQHAADVDTGFDATGAYVTGIDLDLEGYEADEGRVFQASLVDALRSRPGVTEAALAMDLPLDMGSHGTTATPEGWTGPDGRDRIGVDFNFVSPGYFATLGMPVLQGRPFAETDGPGAEPVAMVSRAFVQRVWPEGSPLGRRLQVSMPGIAEEWRTVVGVVEDTHNQMLTDAPGPFVYVPLWQGYRADTKVVVRAVGGLAAVAPLLRRTILELDGSLSVEPVVSLTNLTAMGTLPQRIAAVVTTGMGALALLLSALGVYGVVAYSVTRRTREIGVRVALGASRGSVVRLVVFQGLALALPGLAVGAVLAGGAGYLLRFLLLGLSPADPVAVAGVGVLLLGVVAAASLVPARRAASVAPVEALRSE